MNNSLNLPVLLDEIAGYTRADTILDGVSQPHRAAVAHRLIEGYAARPQTPFDRGYRLRLDEVARTSPRTQ